MLNVSKLESGNLPIERQRVKIHDLLHDIASSMSECARAKALRLELNIPPDLGSARLDKELFRIAIDNVVSNAVKYGRAGGSVVLSAERLPEDRMKICVKDDGIGISPEDAERVFDKYYRSSSKEVSAHGGHGLGLYLAKRIVELHHGTISLRSEPGRGTEFTIQFEAQAARLEALAQA
jgi:signal transduction histidine kinase